MANRFDKDNEFINEVLKDFAEALIRQRMANVSKTKSVASAALLKSYAYELRRATAEQTAMAWIAFEEHGRFLDMQRLNRTQQRPVEVIKEWIQKIGLTKFKRRPSGGPLRTPVSNTRFLNDLAWGIATKRRKHKRRRLQKGIEGLIRGLMSELSEGYLDRTVEEVKASFKRNVG